MQALIVVAMGALGVFLRYGINILFKTPLALTFPWPTFLINVSGSFLIGAVFVVGLENAFLSENLRVGLMAGFLGGFTTFSAFSLESLQLIRDGRFLAAGIYSCSSVVLGLLATYFGMVLARWL